MKQVLSKILLWLPLFLVSISGLTGCKKSDSGADNNNNNSTLISFKGSFVRSDSSVITSAGGSLTASFNPANKELSYTFIWHGLAGKAIEMHIHDAGPIIIPITGFPQETSGTFSGKASITDAQAADLMAGKFYAQIHTENYPGGEILAVFTHDSSTPPPPGDGY